MCSTGRCQSDRAFAVLQGDKVLRISFSKTLCEFIARKVPDT